MFANATIREEALCRGFTLTGAEATENGVVMFKATDRDNQERWIGFDRKASRYIVR